MGGKQTQEGKRVAHGTQGASNWGTKEKQKCYVCKLEAYWNIGPILSQGATKYTLYILLIKYKTKDAMDEIENIY